MIFQNYLVLLILIVIFKKIISIEENKNIRIYETQNNYPKYVILHDGSVLAFSGYKMGTISKYSKEAEELELHIPFIEYDSSLDIKEIENDKFIMVWGKNTKIQIVYVDAKTFKITTTKLNDEKYYSTSYKINVLPFEISGERVVLIAWVNDNIHLEIFKLQSDKQFTKIGSEKEIISNNHFISCISMELTKHYPFDRDKHPEILCEYVDNNSQIIIHKYCPYSNFQFKSSITLYKISKCAFDRIIRLSHSNSSQKENGASCYLQNEYDFGCIFWEYHNTSNDIINLIEFNEVRKGDELQSFDIKKGIKFMSGCFNWIEETDVSLISSNKLVGICLTNETFQNRKVQIAIIEIDKKDKNLQYRIIQLDSIGVSLPSFAYFGNNYLSENARTEPFLNVNGLG